MQSLAIDHVGANLRINDAPHFSIGGALLNIAIEMAISAAAGALGAAVSTGLKKLLNATTEVRRNVITDMLKDGVKEMFKSSVKTLRNLPDSRTGDALTTYINEQSLAMTTAMTNATFETLGLATALRQADLSQLAALLEALRGRVSEAYSIQYEHSMRQWENLRARSAAGEAPYHLPFGGKPT